MVLAGECDLISDIHAIIYQDGIRNWEILNYSPFGITVDGVCYGLEETSPNLEDIAFDTVDSSAKIPTNHKFEEILDINNTCSFSKNLQEKVRTFYE